MKTKHVIFLCFCALILISTVAFESFEDEKQLGEIEELKSKIEIDDFHANLIRGSRNIYRRRKPKNFNKDKNISDGRKGRSRGENGGNGEKGLGDGEKRQGEPVARDFIGRWWFGDKLGLKKTFNRN
uniref:Glycine-rich protein n=1 Tax=Ononis spinosa TaxID=58890 RepID=A0A411AFK3_ONOSP|nr:glycine-rich protein [Ononis spinosa]